MVSKVLTFTGENLVVNYSTSSPEGIRIEIQDLNGVAIPNFSMSDCNPMIGDEIEGIVNRDARPFIPLIASPLFIIVGFGAL